MGNFSPRNVSQLLVGTTTRATADLLVNVGDFTVKAVPVPGAGSGELANSGATVIVKTATGYKVSDFIPANASYKAKTIVAGVLGAATATFPTPTDFINKTFSVTVDFHDHIGSPLNDRFISAYVATDKDGKFLTTAGVLTTGTVNAIVAELALLLAATVKKQGDAFTISSATNVITVTEKAAKFVAGVEDGVNLPWELTGGIKEDAVVGGSFISIPATIAITAVSKPGDLIQLKNVEWFNSGYGKDAYRETGYPASFPADSDLVAAGVANGAAYGIFQFYKDRDATNLERQHKQLIAVGTLAAAINTVLIAEVA